MDKKSIFVFVAFLFVCAVIATFQSYGPKYMAKVHVRGSLITYMGNYAAWVDILEGDISKYDAKVSKDHKRANLPTRSDFKTGGTYYVYYQYTGTFGGETHFALETKPIPRANKAFITWLIISILSGGVLLGMVFHEIWKR